MEYKEVGDAEGEPVYSQRGVVEALRDHGLAASKQRSQCFLYDRNLIDSLLDHAGVAPDDEVIEIGPGLGHTTARLLARGARVCAIELDRGFIPILQSMRVAGRSPQVIHADALSIDLGALWTAPFPKRKVIGNLPYGVASRLLEHMLRHGDTFPLLAVLVQREFAQRMIAGPGEDDYSRLSVLLQYRGRPEIVKHVGPDVFYPKPKVVSSFVVHTLRQTHQAHDAALLHALVKAAFSSRRKTVRRSTATFTTGMGLDEPSALEAMCQAGVDPAQRAETIDIGRFVAWSNNLQRLAAKTAPGAES